MILLLFIVNLLTLPCVFNAAQTHEKLLKRVQAMNNLYTQAEISMGHAIAHELDSLLLPIPTPAPGATFAPIRWSTPAPGASFVPGRWSPPARPPTVSFPSGIGSGSGTGSGSGIGSGSGTGSGSHQSNNVKSKFLDVVIILDSSGSVGSSHFDEAKIAAKTIVRYINMRCPISATGSRVGLIEFSSSGLTNVAFHLGDYSMLWSDLNAVDRVGYDSGPATATAVALQEAKREIERNGIATNAKLVWIITDGMSNEGGDPIAVANLLKDAGIKVCATGVGSSINHAEIDGIASQRCTFYPKSFKEYAKAAEFAYAEANGTVGANFFKDIQLGNQFGK